MPSLPFRTLRLAALALLAATAPACAQGETPAAGAPSVSVDSVVARANRDRMRGSEDAPVTIYEFSDFQCPYCGEFERTTFAALDSALLRTGKARLQFLNLPLPIHGNAWTAAEAALCAGAQGKFWPMHDRLFADQGWSGAARPSEQFQGHARALGLDLAAFETCTREDQVARILTEDVSLAAGNQINGTPTFVMVRKQRPGEPAPPAPRILSGAQPLQAFQTAIDELMK